MQHKHYFSNRRCILCSNIVWLCIILFLPKGKFKFFSKYQIEFLANVFKNYQDLEFTNLNNALPPQKCDKFLIQSTFFTEKKNTYTIRFAKHLSTY